MSTRRSPSRSLGKDTLKTVSQSFDNGLTPADTGQEMATISGAVNVVTSAYVTTSAPSLSVVKHGLGEPDVQVSAQYVATTSASGNNPGVAFWGTSAAGGTWYAAVPSQSSQTQYTRTFNSTVTSSTNYYRTTAASYTDYYNTPVTSVTNYYNTTVTNSTSYYNTTVTSATNYYNTTVTSATNYYNTLVTNCTGGSTVTCYDWDVNAVPPDCSPGCGPGCGASCNTYSKTSPLYIGTTTINAGACGTVTLDTSPGDVLYVRCCSCNSGGSTCNGPVSTSGCGGVVSTSYSTSCTGPVATSGCGGVVSTSYSTSCTGPIATSGCGGVVTTSYSTSCTGTPSTSGCGGVVSSSYSTSCVGPLSTSGCGGVATTVTSTSCTGPLATSGCGGVVTTSYSTSCTGSPVSCVDTSNTCTAGCGSVLSSTPAYTYFTYLNIYTGAYNTLSLSSQLLVTSNTSGYATYGAMQVSTSGNTITGKIFADTGMANQLGSTVTTTPSSPTKGDFVGLYSDGVYTTKVNQFNASA